MVGSLDIPELTVKGITETFLEIETLILYHLSDLVLVLKRTIWLRYKGTKVYNVFGICLPQKKMEKKL